MEKITSRIPSQYPIERTDDNRFFRSVTLGLLYGEHTRPKGRVYLSQEQMKKWFLTPVEYRREGESERIAFARSQGIQWVDSINAHFDRTAGQYYLFEVSPPKLAYWAPHQSEREVLLNLAQALAGKKQHSTIVEVGCGSGIVSRMLAADSNARVIGIDPDIKYMGGDRIPSTPGNIHLYSSDLWNAVDILGPEYDESNLAERKKLLALMEPFTEKPVFEYFGHGDFNAQEGDISALNSELRNLQKITTSSTSDSPVDLVLCSFMDRDKELTVPIRDGIYPKVIVYIRPVSGRSGAGDYYLETTIDESDGAERPPNLDSAISFNPGRNYRTVARWKTPNAIDWKSYDKPPEFSGLSSEVVIQIRNDQMVESFPDLEIPHYSYDKDIEKSFKSESDYLRFRGGIREARQLLAKG